MFSLLDSLLYTVSLCESALLLNLSPLYQTFSQTLPSTNL